MAPHGELVSNQVLAGNELSLNLAIEGGLNTLFPCFVEPDSGDTLQNAYAAGLNAHLEHARGFVVEVSRGHSFERSAILGERGEEGLAIFTVCFDEQIEVLGATRFGVEAHSVAADYKVFDTVGIERR